MALPELSQMQDPIVYCDGGLKLVPRRYKCINRRQDYAEK